MAPSNFICHSLYVRHPILNEQLPGNVGEFSMPSCGPCSAWKVLLKRTGAQLEVSVGPWEPNEYICFQSISLAPFKGGKHWNYTFDKKILQVGNRVTDIEQDNEYQFFIAMSAMDHIPVTSGASRVETLKDEVAIAKNKVIENKASMENLLADVYSVEMRFVFTQDKSSFSNVGLWAHCAILSKHQIERNIDPNRFAISKLDSQPKYIANSGKSTHIVPCWHPLDSDDSPWNLKPVQWDDLLFAADVYGIEELCALCQTHIIRAIENSNAIETLIHVGTQFPDVKEAALDYIARNTDTMFVDGNDPFAPFVQHPKCHELLVEVMLRSRFLCL
ncbi:hypothetical protein BGZ81_002104 [Podila clonocystis]|nr:hypothetical protein BGZ81_002104 [Podila clonocystis]